MKPLLCPTDRRRFRNLFGALLFSMVCAGVMFAVFVLFPRGGLLRFLVPIGAMVAVFLWTNFLGFRARLLFRSTWSQSDGLLCPKCESPLPKPEDGRGTCPECGHADREESIRATWKKWGFTR
jgi:hypothetical protein